MSGLKKTELKTTEYFRAEVNSLTTGEFTVVGDYINAKTKIKIKHNKCGEPALITPNQFLSRLSCRKCAKDNQIIKQRKTTEQFKKEVTEVSSGEYTVVGEYETAHIKIHILHNKCGEVSYVTPNKFLRTYSCCKPCGTASMKKKQRKTQEQFEKEILDLTDNDYIVMGKYKNNRTKVDFLHKNCGKIFPMRPDSFLNNDCRCPPCSHIIEVSKRSLSQEEFDACVQNLVGNDYTFLEPYQNIAVKIKVKHNKCGKVYPVSPRNFIHHGRRCPKCMTSKGETTVGKYLKEIGIKYKSQQTFDGCRNPETGRPFLFDFSIQTSKGIACIEYDGEQHFRPIEIWGGEKSFEITKFRDNFKNEFCRNNNIPLLRIPYTQFELIDDKINTFLDEIENEQVG